MPDAQYVCSGSGIISLSVVFSFTRPGIEIVCALAVNNTLSMSKVMPPDLKTLYSPLNVPVTMPCVLSNAVKCEYLA